jgi:hypothetical protein
MTEKKRITVGPIVCGMDFSATATQAVDIAAAMARRLETSVRPIENKSCQLYCDLNASAKRAVNN